MNSIEIIPVSDENVESAFSVLQATAKWLEGQGRRQRIANTTMDTYRGWQKDGCNHVVRVDNIDACIFSVTREDFSDWPKFRELGNSFWLRALTTHPDFRGMKLGELAVNESLRIIGPGSPLYLDCVSDFLPAYYSKLGFKQLDSQRRDYGPDGVFSITLMKHENGSSDS